MIQGNLKDILKASLPSLSWSEDYYTAEDNTGTVYSTGGFPQGRYEGQVRRPTYQVYIRSSDWDLSKEAAYEVYNLLHMKSNFEAITDEGSRFFVYLITGASEPLRIGVENNIMDYSVNFDVELKQIEEVI